jgi:hypothetical protein
LAFDSVITELIHYVKQLSTYICKQWTFNIFLSNWTILIFKLLLARPVLCGLEVVIMSILAFSLIFGEKLSFPPDEYMLAADFS